MLRKLIVTIFMLMLLPVNAWAIADIKYNIYNPGGGYSIVHGNTYVGNLVGTLYGSWDDSAGVFSGIHGKIKGLYGTVNIDSGSLNFDGSGSLMGSVTSYGYYGVKNYSGTFSFKDSGWYGGYYDNVVSSEYLKLWGGGKFVKSYTPYGSDYSYQSYFKKWLGIDLYGHGEKVEVPAPATFTLMGLGLLGLRLARKKQKI